MSAAPSRDARLQELAERYYNSLEDQLYDPDPKVDGYGKERQKQYILDLLADLAREATKYYASAGQPLPRLRGKLEQ